MEPRLNYDRKFVVERFDKAVILFFTWEDHTRAIAHEQLTRFCDLKDAWIYAVEILFRSKSPQAKFIGLIVLEKMIKTRWKAIPLRLRQGLRTLVMVLDVHLTRAAPSWKTYYLTKLNLTIVEILKRDWPHEWANFIPSMVKYCGQNPSFCENFMNILRLLSEEIFDFSAEQMTQARIKTLKMQMGRDLPAMFRLCFAVLQKASKASLIMATLKTLLAFINWIPLEYIFESRIIDILLMRFLEAPQFRSITIKCLVEIQELDVGEKYETELVTVFAKAMKSINRMIPPGHDLAQNYTTTTAAGKEFVLNLALFLTTFLSTRVRALEGDGHRRLLLDAHFFVVRLSQIDEKEIFKICLEYWLQLASELYEEVKILHPDETKLSIERDNDDTKPVLDEPVEGNDDMKPPMDAPIEGVDSGPVLGAPVEGDDDTKTTLDALIEGNDDVQPLPDAPVKGGDDMKPTLDAPIEKPVSAPPIDNVQPVLDAPIEGSDDMRPMMDALIQGTADVTLDDRGVKIGRTAALTPMMEALIQGTADVKLEDPDVKIGRTAALTPMMDALIKGTADVKLEDPDVKAEGAAQAKIEDPVVKIEEVPPVKIEDPAVKIEGIAAVKVENPDVKTERAGSVKIEKDADVKMDRDATKLLLDAVVARKDIYLDILARLRFIVVERMIRPEEVLIVENEEGEMIREFVNDSDTISIYRQMRDLLVYLTKLDAVHTEAILMERLANQVKGSKWSWNSLNATCWAIGSISGAMDQEMEKKFLATVIKNLLCLSDKKRGKANKAVIASNIMYIAGQYPRILKSNWKFLKAVVTKLFEFMHEQHNGLQDMACDTLIKIAQKCKRHFVTRRSGDQEPLVDKILGSLHDITVDLSAQQIPMFYEAVGYMISANPSKAQQERLISKLMELPNNTWDSLMSQAAKQIDVLASLDNLKTLANVLKTNVAACASIGGSYLPQLGRIFMDMLGLYKAVSGIISASISQKGIVAMQTSKVRRLRTVKKEILKLIDVYIQKAEELEAIHQHFLPPLLDAILGDYYDNIALARDAEVLGLIATVTNRFEALLTPQVPAILDAVFASTLGMITHDFIEFPEHRVSFYRLLREINSKCFSALLEIPPTQFKLFMDSIFWAFKHRIQDIADLGLALCVDVIENFLGLDRTVSDLFFQQFFLDIIQDVFFVLTDAEHKSGFKLQSQILARMYHLVMTDQIKSPLFDPAKFSNNMTNAWFVKMYTLLMFNIAFPHIHGARIKKFVIYLTQHHNDPERFKVILWDFVVQMQEFSRETKADERRAMVRIMQVQARSNEEGARRREAEMRRRETGGRGGGQDRRNVVRRPPLPSSPDR